MTKRLWLLSSSSLSSKHNNMFVCSLSLKKIMTLLLLLFVFFPLFQQQHQPSFVNAFYVSYEKPKLYAKNEIIPLTANKLTSPVTLASLDYGNSMPICSSSSSSSSSTLYNDNGKSQWQQTMESLHGDVYYETTTTAPPATNQKMAFSIHMLQDSYCQHACFFTMDDNTNNNATTTNNNKYQYMIQNDYRYNWYIDLLSVGYQIQDETVRIQKHWGGIPVGQKGTYPLNVYDNERYYQTTIINDTDLLYYNHYNFIIYYKTIRSNKNVQYQIVRAYIEPLSIEHLYTPTNSSTGGGNILTTPIPSCTIMDSTTTSTSSSTTSTTQKQHTSFEMLTTIPPLILGNNNNKIQHFTYDVIWMEDEDSNINQRWDIYLSMDDTVSYVTFGMGIVLSCILLCTTCGILYVWVMRDLSYKPIINLYEEEDDDDEYNDTEYENSTKGYYKNHENNYHEEEEEKEEETFHINSSNPTRMVQAAATTTTTTTIPETKQQQQQSNNNNHNKKYNQDEIQMWPLSTRIFFIPTTAPIAVCCIGGIGSQQLVSTFVFVVLFRLGILSQTSSPYHEQYNPHPNTMVSGAIVIYMICSPFIGGYSTGRLYRILHGERIRTVCLASLLTAVFYPLLGFLVLWLSYDVLPYTNDNDDYHQSPQYNVLSNIGPLIYIWIFYICPMTIVFGWYGYRCGPLQYFPVSKGVGGYQDLNLQQQEDEQQQQTSSITNNNNKNATATTKEMTNNYSNTIITKPYEDDTKNGEDAVNTTMPLEEDEEDIVRKNNSRFIIEDDDDDEMNDGQEMMPSHYYRSDDYADSVTGGSIEDGKVDPEDDDNNKKNKKPTIVSFFSVQSWFPTNLLVGFQNWYTTTTTCTKIQWEYYRIPILFLIGGIVPLLSGFVNYSYGIAAPLFLGYYSISTFAILSFGLFVFNSIGVTLLLYYRQIRVAGSHNQTYYYKWWWATIATGSSTGLWFFFLSFSWLVRYAVNPDYHVSFSTWTIYLVWYGYLSIGIGFMTAFTSLLSVIVFNRYLYMYMIRQQM